MENPWQLRGLAEAEIADRDAVLTYSGSEEHRQGLFFFFFFFFAFFFQERKAHDMSNDRLRRRRRPWERALLERTPTVSPVTVKSVSVYDGLGI